MDEQTHHNGRLYRIRPLEQNDRNWVAHFLDQHWGSTKIVSRGQVHYAHLLPGLAVEHNDAPADAPPIGLATYTIDKRVCEIVTFDAVERGVGVGTLLLEGVKAIARENDCRMIWLITTNDNMQALRFYQKRGFELVAVYPNALADARKLKPQIPLIGLDGIPLRDEIELKLTL